MEDCIFCKIAHKEIPSQFLYDSEKVMAFPDIHPLADVHILIIPKEHIPAFSDISENHQEIISEMIKVAQELVKENGVEAKYMMVFNGGSYQHVSHLHWHLFGGDLKLKNQFLKGR